jgi:hypothetical protein
MVDRRQREKNAQYKKEPIKEIAREWKRVHQNRPQKTASRRLTVQENKSVCSSSSFSSGATELRTQASFLYFDEWKNLLYRADYDSDSQVRYLVKVADGSWTERTPELQVPYNLPELYERRDSVIVLTGDEFDVEGLRSLGIVATCGLPHLNGGYFPKEWARHFVGRGVVILESPFLWHRDICTQAIEVLKGIAQYVSLIVPPDIDVIDTPFGPQKERIHQWLLRKSFTRQAFADWAFSEAAKDRSVALVDEIAGLVELKEHRGDAYEGGATVSAEKYERYEATWKPFPLDALPLVVRQFVAEISHALMVDPAAVALPALVAIAGCIGNSRVLRLKSTWSEPAIMFGCLIGDPSSRKSAAMKAAIAPVKKWNGEKLTEWQTAMDVFEHDNARWHAANGKEAKEQGLSLSPPKTPTRRRILVSNITVETFIPRLAENPRGLLVCRDELRGWFASFGQYAKSGAGADECFWLECFLGDEYHYDRKTGEHTSIRISNLVGSVIGTIQPGMWRRISVQDMFDSGMMGRILTVYPPKLLSTFDSFEPSPEIVQLYENLLFALINLDYDRSNERDWKPRPMIFTPEALQLWTTWDNGARKEQHAAEGEIAAMLGKMEAYCARFALCFGVCDLVMGGTNDIVEARHVQSAIKLYDWFVHEAERNYAIADSSAVESAEARIMQRIQSVGGSISAWDLWKSNRRKWRDTDQAAAALDQMAGIGRKDDDKKQPVLTKVKSSTGYRYFIKGSEAK